MELALRSSVAEHSALKRGLVLVGSPHQARRLSTGPSIGDRAERPGVSIAFFPRIPPGAAWGPHSTGPSRALRDPLGFPFRRASRRGRCRLERSLPREGRSGCGSFLRRGGSVRSSAPVLGACTASRKPGRQRTRSGDPFGGAIPTRGVSVVPRWDTDVWRVLFTSVCADTARSRAARYIPCVRSPEKVSKRGSRRGARRRW